MKRNRKTRVPKTGTRGTRPRLIEGSSGQPANSLRVRSMRDRRRWEPSIRGTCRILYGFFLGLLDL
jgi:hypothetical protein